jgi:hypothetical protein
MTNHLYNATNRDITRRFLLMVGCLAVWGCGLAMSRGAMTLVFVDAAGKETTLVAGTNKLPSLNGNIRADGAPALTQSVLFKINGESMVENVPPYYAYGDVGSVPKMHQFQARSYIVSAAAYRYDNAKGANLDGVSVSFTLALGTPDNPPPPPPPPPPPGPGPGGIRAPRGYSIYPQGNRQYGSGPSLSAELLAHKPIEWILFRDRWKYMEPKDDQYDLSLMKKELQRYVAAGKKVGILVMTGGGCSPDWLVGPRHQGVLVPWAPSIGPEFRELLGQISNLEITPGLKLRDDPRLVMVYPNGPTVPSHEMHLQGMENAPGFSAEAMYQAWAYAIDSQHLCFPNVAGGIAISVNQPVLPYLDRVLSKLRATKGPQLAFAQHNALSNKDGIRNRTYEAHKKLFDLHAQGWKVGCEALDSAQDNPTRMETNDFMVAVRNLPVGTYFVGYPPDWRHYKAVMP